MSELGGGHGDSDETISVSSVEPFKNDELFSTNERVQRDAVKAFYER